MSLGGGGFVTSMPGLNLTYKGSYSASLPAGITALTAGGNGNIVHYWQAGPLFLGMGTLQTSALSAGSGDLTIALPDGLTWKTANMAGGATTNNQGAPLLGFAEYFIQGGGWKFAHPHYAGSTQVFFTENTQHIQANELTTGDTLKYWLMGPVNEWS